MVEREKWPTPRANERGDWQNSRGTRRLTLTGAVKLFPTPTVSDAVKGDCPSERKRKSPSLVSAARTWRTPQADENGSIQPPESRDGHNISLSNQVGGSLNPDWVEWLMGWPLGWTSLEPLPLDVVSTWQVQTGIGAWWESDPSEDEENPVPRVAVGVARRGKRLHGLGNGQVPVCVVMAWQLLTEDLEISYAN